MSSRYPAFPCGNASALVVCLLSLALSGAAFAQEKKTDLLKNRDPLAAHPQPVDKPPGKATGGGSIEIIRASEAEYVTVGEGEEGIFILRGGIIVRSGKAFLRAETVKINTKTGEIFGEGQVSFESEGARLTGDKFYYENNSDAGVVYSAHGESAPFFLAGSSIKQVESQRYIARDAFFTSCEEKFPHYHFKAKKLFIYKNNELAALSAIYYIGQTPVFYWPLLLQSDTGTGIVTQYGNNPSRGHFLQNTWSFLSPNASASQWLPQRGKLIFDWYERVGYMFGTVLRRDADFLKYNLDIGLANFKARRAATDTDGSTVWTNQVLQPDGTYGLTQYFWHKVKADMKSNFYRSQKDDTVTSAYVRFEHYKHPNFDAEFGERYEPEITFNALYRPRFGQLGRSAYGISWETGLAYTNKDTQVSMRAVRSLGWYQSSNDANSKYLPVQDIAPDFAFSNRMFLLRGGDGFFKGIMNRVQLNSLYRQDYRIETNGDTATSVPVKSYLQTEGFDQVSMYLTFFPWLNFIPSVGAGAIYTYTNLDDMLIQREQARQSYGYLFTSDTLRVGYPLLYAQGIYTRRYSFADRGQDLTFYHDRAHAITTSLISDLNPYAIFSVTATRDLRPYPNQLTERDRWSDLVTRGQGDYDFIRGFTVNLYGLNQRRFNHMNGIGVVDSAAYSIQFNTMNTNDFQVYYRLGGYRLPLIRELLLFKITSTYRHNFINVYESNLRLGFETDLQLHDYWRLRLTLNSIADQFERYQSSNPAYVNFFDDALKSANPFSSTSRENRVLNLESFFASLEHDLHRWLFRVSFSTARKTVFTGSYLRDRTTFLEQTIYISFTLKDLTGFGLPYQELYRYNPTDAGNK